MSIDAAGRSLEIVAAIAANGVIGAQGRLPWRLPEDLRRFRTLTSGHAILMGRRTFESLPGALAERQNIVLTRDPSYRPAGAETAPDLDAALARVERPGPVFCIGGAEIYRLALPFAHRLHLTEIGRAYDGDVRFPDRDPASWREVARERHVDLATAVPCDFVVYERAA
ncbi:MAG: dihydrofolate reductase [Burkholderiales bacterium]